MSTVYRVLLVVWDAVCINACSFMALFLRYDLNIDRYLRSGINAEYPLGYVATLRELMIFNTIMTLAVFALFRLYKSLWRYAGINEVLSIAMACGVAGVLHFLTVFGTYHKMPRSYFLIYMLLLFILTLAVRFSYRIVRLIYKSNSHGNGMRTTLIIGAGEACNIVIRELKMSDNLDSHICGIIDDDKSKHGTYIQGIRVLGGREEIVSVSEENEVNEIIVAMPSASKKQISEILEICQQTGSELKIVPGVYQFVNGEAAIEKIRPVQIEDLLGREPVNINLDAIINYVRGKVILVTGGGDRKSVV